jgi:serine/threonine-protein kinase
MLDTLFALKVLNPDVAEEKPEYVKRFVREAKLATRIRHPNLVAVHDAGFDGDKGVYFLVMDYVNGDTLRKPIAFGGGMPEKDAVSIILQVADVLAAAQRFGMVHRDLKPENIMLTSDGTVKLLDLGIAKVSGGIDSLKTTTNTVFGTPAYISPEQVYGDVELDCRADIYSLAATIFHLATGRVLFPGLDNEETMRAHCAPEKQARDPRTYRPELSEGFCQLLEAMLVKDREYRVSSWSNVFQMCQDVESGAKFKPRAADAASSIKLLS